MGVDLHCHDEYSTFDGYGSPIQRARRAKELGHTSLAISNHGTTSGLVKHYTACKEEGINCIMGVEAYFIPTLKKGSRESYHLCLYAKNLKGYQNLNRIVSASEEQKYYKPLVTFENLEQYHEGVICTTACIAGYLSQKIIDGNIKLAEKALLKFKKIFGDDFYIEIQPYKLEEEGVQERVNVSLMKLARKHKVKCILTSDSHYTIKEEFDTYLKMHEIAGTTYDVVATYKEHYIPSMSELVKRFHKMHKNSDIGIVDFNAINVAKKMVKNLEEIESKVEQNILDKLVLRLPKVFKNADEVLKRETIKGLKAHGKFKDKEYVDRCKYELEVIKEGNVSDYFLIVQDYVKYAKDNGIPVGCGRGSVCNCQVANEIGITEVDSIRFGIAFERFLRKGKAKLPDIDIDFATNRRQEVIDYLIDKYGESSAQVSSYGLYKIDNAVNDLGKQCGLTDVFDKKEIKKLMNSMLDEKGNLNYDSENEEVIRFNNEYDNICTHVSRLYKKIRQMGVHAAGVAIVDGDIRDYCAIIIKKDASGKLHRYTAYDLADLGAVHVEKFDMLGLGTMEELGNLRELTGNSGVTEMMYTDKKIWDMFKNGNTEGIFQFDNKTPREILKKIKADTFEDIIATNSMNRPAPLKAKMPELYAYNKEQKEQASKNKWYEFTKETHGVVVYQEQLQKMVVEIGGFTLDEADKLLKIIKGNTATQGDSEIVKRDSEKMLKKFVENAQKKGWTKKEAHDTFKALMSYLFNKGHATGYAKIILEEMYYRVYHTAHFWAEKLNTVGGADAETKAYKYKKVAVKDDGVMIFFPSVNATAKNSVEEIDGEFVIREGLRYIKDVGEKAAFYIENERLSNGNYKGVDDFITRCKVKGSPVNKKAINALEGAGALVFDEVVRKKRTIKYLSTLLS